MQSVSLHGLRRIGQGGEAEVFEWQDGRVLRLLRAHGSVARLASEVAALDAARSAGVRVPRSYEEVVVDGRPGLVMERLQGPDLLTIIGQKPWRVFASGRLAGEIHARINTACAPASLPSVRESVGRGVARLASLDPGIAEWVSAILAYLPDGDALCHGDFHPGQLMCSDGRCAVFDWSGAKRGDALFDHARTRVVLGIGEPPPGTQLTLRLLARVGRQLLVSSYARAYERHVVAAVDRARLRHWEIVNLAARLTDNVPGEQPRILRSLRAEFAKGS